MSDEAPVTIFVQPVVSRPCECELAGEVLCGKQADEILCGEYEAFACCPECKLGYKAELEAGDLWVIDMLKES